MSEEQGQGHRGFELRGWHALGLWGAGMLALVMRDDAYGLVANLILCFSAVVLGIWLLVRKEKQDERSLTITGTVLAGLWFVFMVLQPLLIRLLKPH
jgi:hypothetical protein